MVDPLGASSSMRMFGLASGLDIDSMVEKLMTAERVPLDKMTQQRQILQWQQDDYRSMNSLLLDLYNSTFDMTLQSNYLMRQATSTNETYITATASSSSPNTSYLITSGSMATAAYNVSSDGTNPISIASTGKTIDPQESLWNMRGSFATDPFTNITSTAVSAPETITQQADGTYKLAHGYIDTKATTTFSDGTTSYKVFFSKDEYNKDTSTNKVYVDAVTGDLTFNNTPPSTLQANYSYVSNPSTSFSVTMQTPDDNGVMQTHTWSFDGTKSLNDVMDTINNDSTAGVTMFFDSSAEQVSIVRNKTGDYNTNLGTTVNHEMTFSSTGDFLTNTLKLNESYEKGGDDSSVTLNGLTTKHHENTFSINGVTFNLKANIPVGTTVSVNITNDTSGIYDKIKSWVDKYNDTIQKINDKISEKKYRDYPPLTDAQKKDMKDNDIELWNEKAMSGMLSDDQLLPNGLNQMRMDIYTSVGSVNNSDYDQLAKIGITTSADYTEHGKLEIDEAKLKAAIAADPTSVMDLFTNSGIPSGGKDPVYADEGIMKRLQTSIQNTMDSIYQEAGKDTYTYDQFYLGKSIHEYEGRISDFQKHLQDVQDRYYRQFTAMEQAIQQANQQGSFLSQNFGG